MKKCGAALAVTEKKMEKIVIIGQNMDRVMLTPYNLSTDHCEYIWGEGDLNQQIIQSISKLKRKFKKNLNFTVHKKMNRLQKIRNQNVTPQQF